jgi:hypothetical protein
MHEMGNDIKLGSFGRAPETAPGAPLVGIKYDLVVVVCFASQLRKKVAFSLYSRDSL